MLALPTLPTAYFTTHYSLLTTYYLLLTTYLLLGAVAAPVLHGAEHRLVRTEPRHVARHLGRAGWQARCLGWKARCVGLQAPRRGLYAVRCKLYAVDGTSRASVLRLPRNRPATPSARTVRAITWLR